MNTLSEHFDKARNIAIACFWSNFAKEGYERDDLHTAPRGIVALCFEHADNAAWAFLKKSGAMQLPEWTHRIEATEGNPF